MELQYALEDLLPIQRTDFMKIEDELRNDLKIPEIELGSSTIHRFYSSENYSYIATLKKLRNHILWRKNFGFERAANLEAETYKAVSKYVTVGIYGSTHDHVPIGYIHPKTSDVFASFEELGEQKLLDYQVQMFERLSNIVFPYYTQIAKRNINKIVCVVDVKDVNMWKLVLSTKLIYFIYDNMKTYRDNYPEMNRETLIINSCSTTSFFFNSFIAGFISRQTRHKITFYSGNKYMDRLKELTDISQIPKKYGGTCEYDIDKYPNGFNEELQLSVIEKRVTRRK